MTSFRSLVRSRLHSDLKYERSSESSRFRYTSLDVAISLCVGVRAAICQLWFMIISSVTCRTPLNAAVVDLSITNEPLLFMFFGSGYCVSQYLKPRNAGCEIRIEIFQTFCVTIDANNNINQAFLNAMVCGGNMTVEKFLCSTLGLWSMLIVRVTCARIGYICYHHYRYHTDTNVQTNKLPSSRKGKCLRQAYTPQASKLTYSFH